MIPEHLKRLTKYCYASNNGWYLKDNHWKFLPRKEELDSIQLLEIIKILEYLNQNE